MRVTLSKSGISTSVGIKGARLTSGPRGTYVTIGGGGISYRQRISQTSNRFQHNSQTPPEPQRISSPNSEYDPTDPFAIKTADISELVRASDISVLQEINERSRIPVFGPWVYGSTTLLFFTLGGFGSPIAWIVGIIGGLLGLLVSKGDRENRTTPLFYDLDEQSTANYNLLNSALENLASSQKIWRINAQQGNSDWKRNAGAGVLMKRGPASVALTNPPFVRTNLQIYGLNAGNFEMYFLPDYVLVRQQGQYAALGYSTINIESLPTSFIEDGTVPQDAELIRRTWQYVNKGGGPDRRFKNNRQLPVMRYAEINVRAVSGLNAVFHVSNIRRADKFTRTFQQLNRQNVFSYAVSEV